VVAIGGAQGSEPIQPWFWVLFGVAVLTMIVYGFIRYRGK
jgi:hypothetical protein